MKKISNWIGAAMIAVYVGAFVRAYIEDHEPRADDQVVRFECITATGEDARCSDKGVQFILLNGRYYVRQK